jgi:tetratricopeptide (TPR) repeat protein
LHEGGDAAAALGLLPEIEALEAPDWPARYACNRLNVEASGLRNLGRYEQALATWRRMLQLGESEPGETLLRETAQVNLCFGLNHMRRFDEVAELAAQALQKTGHGLHDQLASYLLTHLLVAQVRLGRIEQARETMRRAVPQWRRDSSLPSKCCELALLFAKLGRLHEAARLDGAAEAFSRTSGYRVNALADEARRRTQALFDEAALNPGVVERARREGAALDLDAIVALCLAEPDATGQP